MAYLNKVLLIGNLGKDPEIRVTQSGQKQAKFSLATTERYKDKNSGEYKDKTDWHNIVAWRVVAEQLERLQIRKGTSLFIEGRISNRSWDDPSGQKRYSTDIEIERFQILTPRDRSAGGPSQDWQGGQSQGFAQNNSGTNAPQSGFNAVDNYDAAADDMPF